MRGNKKAIWQEFLKINEITFRYYLILFFVLLFMNLFWSKDFVFRYLRFPLSWLFGFILASGFLKIVKNRVKLKFYAEKTPFFLRLPRLFSMVERFYKKLGRHCFFISNLLFVAIFVIYFSLLIWANIQKANPAGWLSYGKNYTNWILAPKKHIMDWLLCVMIFLGIVSVRFRKKESIRRRDSLLWALAKVVPFSILVVLGVVLIFVQMSTERFFAGFLGLFFLLFVVLFFVILQENKYVSKTWK